MAAICQPVSVSIDTNTRALLDSWMALSHSNRSETIRRACLLVASDPQLSVQMSKPEWTDGENPAVREG